MQSYDEIVNSGTDWLGYIPAQWSIRRGKFLYQNKKVVNKGMAETQRLALTLRGVIERKDGDNLGLNPESLESYQVFEKNDLVFKLIDLENKQTSRVGLTPKRGIMSPAYIRLTPKLALSPGYFFYYYYSLYLTYVFNNIAGEGVRANLSAKELLELPAPVPSLQTQQKIADFLDTETAQIDNLIAKQERLLEMLEEKRRATITHAVTRGLNPSVELKETNIPWLGQIPRHWGEVRVKHLVKELEAGTSVNASSSSDDTGVYVLKTSAVYTRRFRADENKPVLASELHRVSCPVRKGAVVISRMNTPELVGASAYVEDEHSDIYLPDRLWQTRYIDESAQDSRYLAYFFRLQGFRDQISLAAEGASSSMQTISKNKFLNIKMACPATDEQKKISDYLDGYNKRNDLLMQKIQTQIALLRERRTSLISHAVTGKVMI